MHNFSDLIKNKTSFTVIFEAERGPTSESDIAIDDITFTPCSHGKSNPYFSANTKTYFESWGGSLQLFKSVFFILIS